MLLNSSRNTRTSEERVARPFLKWAGGKTQLLTQIEARLPAALREGRVRRYVEPFTGGGAVFFHIAQRYAIAEFVLCDRSEELVMAYRAIQQAVHEVIDCLQSMQDAYQRLSADHQQVYYYHIRQAFNSSLGQALAHQASAASAERTAQLIFLNRTCYNGLFRVNASGAFNVPFGRYQRPTICDAANLRAASRVLQPARILHGDFEVCRPFVDDHTFVYFDPPYRPISKTASFNAYARHAFDDAAQQRLAGFYQELHGAGAKLMLSNSDPRNEAPDDDFFQVLYQGFNIQRVFAKRAINSNRARRGEIAELLITNYAGA